ncbi:universal stress protein [Haloarcula sp. NS06]|jgi:nucleotide-binding universal stress UspA family protein|uniref:Universal stress protein n=4 Tax=Haloarcula TaxID=2237 RepID=Q5UY19_HALMA|nr:MULTISPECIES: universal stress protein [Haloarcula]AAV47834.1 universal stress protein [Haloarcula marismortui ATCC 43049]EMA12159.1 universal stress protein [Haloarcula sinaiiensis ATCC 33800]EMA17727.1 universal stress protein [Haloarcula californiae ATCC 33799]MDQ2071042.1 universal stress protein [Haloarcula sp. H-GB4]NHN64277.1 universal stress protein [Haloarcula sp. JP-Z28]
MYEIVAGIDKSEARGTAIAESITEIPMDASQVRVTLLHDFEENPEGASVDQVASVRRAREVLEDAGVEVALEESSGEPADAILRLADEQDVDMIVVAGRKRTPTGKVLFGSVTQSVILGTDRSVLVCSGEEE